MIKGCYRSYLFNRNQTHLEIRPKKQTIDNSPEKTSGSEKESLFHSKLTLVHWICQAKKGLPNQTVSCCTIYLLTSKRERVFRGGYRTCFSSVAKCILGPWGPSQREGDMVWGKGLKSQNNGRVKLDVAHRLCSQGRLTGILFSGLKRGQPGPAERTACAGSPGRARSSPQKFTQAGTVHKLKRPIQKSRANKSKVALSAQNNK